MFLQRQSRPFDLILCVAFAFSSSAAEPDVLSFAKKNCASCHNSKVASGDVDLATPRAASSFDEQREMWERVVTKLKSGEMPPPGLPRPSTKEIESVAGWLEHEFARQDSAMKPDPGAVSARRLNRSEYNNTMRDLLGVDIRPADNFPADGAAFGFDNISDALNLPPVLLDKYVDAAERSVRAALFGPEKLKPAMTHYPSPVRIPKLPSDLTDYDVTGLSTHHATHVTHRFPVEGIYSFRLVLNGHRPNQSEPAHVGFFIDGKLTKEFEVDATDLEGQICELRTHVPAGEHLLSATYLRVYHGLPPKYNGPEPSQRPPEPLINTQGKLTEKDIEILRKFGTRIKTDRTEVRVDNRFESMDVGGPFEQRSGPSQESLRRIFVCGHTAGHHQPACARLVIAKFAERAFRRPVTKKEVEFYLDFAELARKSGDSFEESIATALEAVLISPNFLFRIERRASPVKAGTASVPVSDFDLASRLSYFLWSSTPDDTLLRLARANRLHLRPVLDAQIRRMLADTKSDALVENFAGQWLQFRNIDVVRPDGERFPDFDESLRHSMRRETELFLRSVIQGDRSVLDFLDADYTFLDERLARFYGVPGVTGPEFRRVDVRDTKRGGGLLAQSSILTISSYSTRTSPVLRGKWILENVLNAPPPPPPPSVPALDDTKVGESASLRQQMEAHRKNPACASCHARMDPLGFGLENFDAIGGWREVDGKFPVDASGMLPGNRSFKGPRELKAQLKLDRDAFVRGLTEKLLIYALGRGLERYDRPVVSSITAGLPAKDYRFSQVILGIANSLPFRERRVAAEPTQTTRAGISSR